MPHLAGKLPVVVSAGGDEEEGDAGKGGWPWVYVRVCVKGGDVVVSKGIKFRKKIKQRESKYIYQIHQYRKR